MTKLQKEIIERVKAHDGIVVASYHGLYTRFGQYVAFVTGGHSGQQSSAARTSFLEKFFVPFSKEEMLIVRNQQKRNIARYKTHIINAVKQNKFESAQKLSEAAYFLQEKLLGRPLGADQYFRLKEGI